MFQFFHNAAHPGVWARKLTDKQLHRSVTKLDRSKKLFFIFQKAKNNILID